MSGRTFGGCRISSLVRTYGFYPCWPLVFISCPALVIIVITSLTWPVREEKKSVSGKVLLKDQVDLAKNSSLPESYDYASYECSTNSASSDEKTADILRQKVPVFFST